jgi:hypothetical protein
LVTYSSDSLETILAEREITRVLHLYCRAIDRLDERALRSIYHPGAVDDHGTYAGTAEGFIEYVLDRLPRVYSRTQHSLSNISIEVRGDAAFAESYVTATHVLCLDSGGTGLYTFTGRYIDRFERREGAWRIADRKLLRTWDGFQALTRSLDGAPFDLPDPSPHADGVRSREDPSYER